MKNPTSTPSPVFRLLTWFLLVISTWLPATAQEGNQYPLGPIGGTYRVSSSSSAALVATLTAGAPGVTAGLQVGDFIYGAYGRTFTPTGSYHYGVSQELGFAVDRAEGSDGILPLLVLRPGTGGLTINVSLSASGALGVAYPRNSAKYAAMYETAVADLHTRVMNSSNGDLGYFTGWTGLALLGHPNWNDTTGAKPYRLSINKLRDLVVSQLNSSTYAPCEDLLLPTGAGQLNGGSNPNSNGGHSNWQLGQKVMFLAEYYAKSADATVLATLQRGAEMCGNSIQWWKQPAQHANGFSPEYDSVAGMCSHGGVTGDYMHQGWYCGINICGVYSFNGMAFSRRAGMDMTVRPKDGHYFGYTLNQGDTIPAGVDGCLPASITLPQYGADPVRGSTITDPFWYDMSVHQKFVMQLNFLARRSTSYSAGSNDDGCVGYAPEAITSYDAGGRTPGTLLGMAMYNQDVGGLDSADLNRMESLKGYITRNYMRHQEAHAYCVGAQAYQAMCAPYLSDRQQRFFMDNWRFFFALSRTATNGIQYFPSRSVADNYLDTNHCASINIALPYAIANGNYSLIPAYNTNRSLADFKSPVLMWPSLAARAATVTTSTQDFQIDICDGNGNVLTPGSYTSAWSHVSGPATATFSPDNVANTTVTFPTVSATPYRIRLTVSRAGVPDLTEDIDVTRANATTPVAPAIATQPTPQTTVPGGSASFTVGVTGTGPFVYQWRLNGVAYWGTSTSPTLSLTNIGGGHVGSYDCVVTTPTGTLVSNSAALTLNATLARTQGGLRREVWNGLGGSAITDLTNNANYPLFPSVTSKVSAAESGEAYGDNYGQKLSGWIKPPVTGAYKFFISSDDASQLWLSTDDTAANKVLIANFGSYTGFRSYSSGAQSAFVNLVAGQKYYIEILHKEGGGGDHVSVSWQLPGESAPANGSAPIDGIYLEYDQYQPLLVDHWKLDETSGTTAVNAIRALNGTHTNGPLVNQASASGTANDKSVYYDGINDYTSTAAPNYNTNTLTMMAWVKRSGVQPAWAQIFFCRAGNTCAGFGSGDVSGNLRYHWNASQYTWDSGLTLPDNQWALVALVVTPSGATFHMRTATGLQSATHSVTLAAEEFDGTMGIGADISISTRRFKGWIDDARIYKSALAASDIETLYNAGINAAPQVTPGTFAVAENSALGTAVGTVSATDADAGQTLTYSIVGGNVGNRFAIDPSSGVITTNGTINYEQFTSFVLNVRATDNGTPAASGDAVITINVTNVEEAPVFVSNPLTGTGGTVGMPYSGTVTATDQDAGSSISYAKTGGPAWLAVAAAGGLTGTPSAGDTGLNSFTIRATDNTALTTDVTLNITVVNPAEAPVWINPAGGSWPTASNWLGNAVATGSGITADFATLNLTADTAVTLDGSRTIGGLKFGDTTASHNWTLATGTGGPLTLAGSGSPLINVVNQTATIATALDGTMGLTKSGTGMLVLSGANTYTGETLISAGTLRVGGGGTSGNLGGTVVTNNGLLEFHRSDSLAVPQAISGTGNIYVKPGGTFTFSGSVSTATFRFHEGGSRTVTFSGSLPNTINVIADNQDGHGNLYLAKSAGVNAFSGPVLDVGSGYASQFQVRLDNHNQIPDTTSVAMYGWDGGYGGRSWFRLNGFNETIAGLTGGTSQSYVQNNAATPSVLTLAGTGTYTLGGYLSNGSTGTLSLVMNGTGSQTLSGSGINYTGTTGVTNGTLRLSQATGFASATTTVTSPGTLELTSTNTTVDNWRLNTVLAGTGVINKTGTGWVQTNTNAHTFSGTFNIAAGAFGTSNLSSNWSGVTADFNVSSGALLDARGQAITLGGLNGAGSVGTTWTSAASVTLGAGNKSGSFSGVISGNASSATNLTANPNAGVLSLTKTGTGTQTLTGANTYTGTTTVNGGALLINGSLASGATTVSAAATLGGTGTLGGATTVTGTLAPGSSGIGNLTVNNSLTLAPGSKLAWEISDWTGAAGTGWDKLTATTLNLTATSGNPVTIRPADVSLANFTETNTTFVLVQTTSGITGFSADKFTVDVSGLTVPQGTWTVQQSGNNLLLAYTRHNTAPSFTSDPILAGATEDSAFSGGITATDPDIAETLTYSKVSGPAWLAVSSNGALSGTPANGDVGTNNFTVRVTDSIGAQDTAALAITVANTNDAPVFTENPMTGPLATQGLAYSSTLAGRATDPDAGDTLGYSKVSGPAWLTVSASGDLTGTPANSDVGANDFTVRVTDAGGLYAEATITITVENTNDAPVFTADPIIAGATEDTAFTGQLDASDIDAGDTLTYAKVSGPAWLTVSGTGALSGTPAGSDVGPNSFTVRVTDALGAFDEALLEISVADLNQAPVFASDPILASAVVDIAFTGQLDASDPNPGNTISFSKVAGPAWLTVDANGSLSGTAGSGTAGVNAFTVRATDNEGAFADASLNITVVDYSITTPWINAAGGSWTVAGNWLDDTIADGDANVGDFSTLDLTADTAVNLDGSRTIGGLKFGDTTPTHNWTLNTGSGGPLTLAVVAGVPVVTVSNQTATINTALTGSQGLVKSGSGTLALGADSTLTGGVTVSQGTLRVGGNSTLGTNTVTLGDAGTGTSAVSWLFPGSGTPSTPIVVSSQGTGTATIGTYSGGLYTAASGPLTLNRPTTLSDATGDRTTFNGKISGPVGTLTIAGTRITLGNSTNDFIGNVIINNGSVLQTDAATALPATTGVTINGGSFRFNNSGAQNIDALNGSGTVFIIAGGATTLSVGNNGGSGAFSGAISNNAAILAFTKAGGGTQVLSSANTYTGPTSVNSGTLIVDGSLGNTVTTVAAAGTLGGTGSIAGAVTNNGTLAPGNNAIGTLTVNNTLTLASGSAIAWQLADWTGTNDQLAATALDLTATAGNPVAIAISETALVNFTETSRTFTLVQTTGGITGFDPAKFVIDTGALTTPQGVWSIEQAGNSLNLVYTRPNTVPFFAVNPIDIGGTQGIAVSGSIIASDPDLDETLTYTKLGGPAWLSINADGVLTGTPLNSDVGLNVFTVQVTDSFDEAATATLNINVANVNDAPVFTANPINGGGATEDSAYSGSIAGAASDIDDGDSLIFTKVSGPAWLNVASNGALGGTPANGDVGANSFTVRVTDAGGLFAQTSLNITVANVNDAPVFTADPINLAATEDSALTDQIAATDADAGETLTFTKVSGPAWLGVSATGALSGTPTNSEVGANTFVVRVTDVSGAFDEAALNITVANVNDAPVFTVDPILESDATLGTAYTGQTLAGKAADADAGDTITYSKVSGPAWLSVASNGALTGTPPSGSTGLNTFVVRATDSAATTDDAELRINVIGLPLPWTSGDIGTGMLAGSTTYNTGAFTEAGSGALGGTTDKLQYAYQTLTGDGEIIARISSLQNTGSSSRVGVMIRDTLATNSKQIFMGMTSTGNYRWVRRTTTGGSNSTSNSSTGTVPNTWVRLTRAGNTITAYKSTNGTSWTTVGSATVTMATNCYIGLAVSSGSNTTLNSSQFSNVSVTP